MANNTAPVLLTLSVLAAAAAAAAAEPRKAPATSGFTHHQGALMSGGDIGEAQNLTTAAAVAHCASLDACEGFTFECGGYPSPCPASSDQPVKTYFKTSTSGNTDAGWWTYVVQTQRPKLLAVGGPTSRPTTAMHWTTILLQGPRLHRARRRRDAPCAGSLPLPACEAPRRLRGTRPEERPICDQI